MTTKFSGRCLCGSITYEYTGSPKFSLICQCSQCQKITGAGHAAQFAVPKDATAINGNVKQYELTSESGNTVASAFCQDCGSPIYKTTSMMPDLLMFHVATLDDPSTFKPEMVVYSESGQSWDHVDPSIPRK